MTAMKSPLIDPPEKPAAADPQPLIDTSKMSEGQRAALELTEAARESMQERTFVDGLFMGEFDYISPSSFKGTKRLKIGKRAMCS